ncbi:hypothetical protein INS49_004625 [Diaporthe citri]|uniref:uncharacterized protein n=1 Tax=Diaporthe citri TaxID=83186 RepID=UPI001C7E3984|nr:uncharacterized protein INS49_004625 [Diaporthe citri]KAG6354607.1 hypothetical protein INS49_004625 [Diaporthe citri]
MWSSHWLPFGEHSGDLLPIGEPFGAEQNPVSRRRLARDIAEMVNDPYPNTELTPGRWSLYEPCLVLNTGTRLVHVSLRFGADYPRTPPAIFIGGRARHPDPDGLLCSTSLASRDEDKSAYTIKTFAMHLLSMFDGDTELAVSPHGFELRIQSEWEEYKCSRCKPPTTRNPPTIRDLPVEILNKILDHLEVQDIVRFGQAWDRIEEVVEANVAIRDRELQCFVTKEHLTHSPLGIGVRHGGGGGGDDNSRPAPFDLELEFDLISQTAFRDLGIRTSAYGCRFGEWLPLPLSERHWEQVEGDALQCLDRLAETMYSGFRHSPTSDALDVLTTLMDAHVLKLFTNVERRQAAGGTSGGGARGYTEPAGHLQASEKGIESMFFLFHLLCVAVARPELVDKANNMVRSFHAGSPPAHHMPSPGRILVALLISELEVDTSLMVSVVTEAITRNAPALLTRHPELSHLEPDGAASAYRLHHTFMGGLASYRALMFMDVFQRTVRPATNGTTLEQAATPSSSAAGSLPRPPPPTSPPRPAASWPVRFLSGCLRDAVREGMRRENVLAWPLDEAAVLVLRRTAEHWSTLPRTERLPPCPEWPPDWEIIARAQALGYYPDGTP